MKERELAEPYASPPGRPGKYVMYFSRWRDDDTQVMVQVFAAPYSARKFLDICLSDDDVIWELDGVQIRTESGIRVKSERMREIFDHEYTLPEMGWEMMHPHRNEALSYRHREQPRDIPAAISSRNVDKAERKARKLAGVTGRASRVIAGMVSIGQIAAELEVVPREARGALRKLGMKKGPNGWMWPQAEVENVKNQIKEALK